MILTKTKCLHSFFNPNKKTNTKKWMKQILINILTNLDEGHLNINNYMINYEMCENNIVVENGYQVDYKGVSNM